MIVVTGPGRSGTSLIAQLYRDLGVDPGGVWNAVARAGFEDPEIVRMNRLLVRELGVDSPGRRFGFVPDDRVPDGFKSALRRFLPASVREHLRSMMREPPWRSTKRLDVIQWDRFDDAIARYGDELRRLAGGRVVAKDPAFCWTLVAWLGASAPIHHVVVTVRPLDAMAKSRLSQQWLGQRSLEPIKNWMGYGVGLLMSAIYDARLSHSVLRFPDFLSEPEEVFAAMRLPPHVTYETFLDAFDHRVRPDFVHDAR